MLQKYTQPEKWIILGTPFLFIIGSLFHFLYEISGENKIVGALAPVNESIWEHLKLVLIPVSCYWILFYLFAGIKTKIEKDKWFTGAIVALLVALITIPLGYYFYTGAFGVKLLAVDIALLFLALIFGQGLGLHIYRYFRGVHFTIPIMVTLCVILLFVMFTFYPPHLPLFRDNVSNQYGIVK
jgi:hypothetical protein